MAYIKVKNEKTQGKLLHCEYCGEEFVRTLDFDHHVYRHHGTRRYKCSECGQTYVTRAQLVEHMGQHNNQMYECGICNAKYVRLQHCKAHRAMHFANGRERELDVSIAETNTNTTLYKIITVAEGTSYECIVCHAIYPKLSSVVLHVRMHLPKQHLCPDCGLYFGSVGSLTQHRNIHGNNKKFPCNHCNLAFHQEGFLENHVRSAHNQVDPFRCVDCLTEFRSAIALAKHRQVKGCIKKPFPKKYVPVSLQRQYRKRSSATIGNIDSALSATDKKRPVFDITEECFAKKSKSDSHYQNSKVKQEDKNSRSEDDWEAFLMAKSRLDSSSQLFSDQDMNKCGIASSRRITRSMIRHMQQSVNDADEFTAVLPDSSGKYTEGTQNCHPQTLCLPSLPSDNAHYADEIQNQLATIDIDGFFPESEPTEWVIEDSKNTEFTTEENMDEVFASLLKDSFSPTFLTAITTFNTQEEEEQLFQEEIAENALWNTPGDKDTNYDKTLLDLSCNSPSQDSEWKCAQGNMSAPVELESELDFDRSN